MNKKTAEKKDAQLNVRVDRKFLDNLDRFSEQVKCTRTEFIRRVCEKEFARLGGDEPNPVFVYLHSIHEKINPHYAVADSGRKAPYQKDGEDTCEEEIALREFADIINYLIREGMIILK
ncbi:MAG: hypothetical protein Q4Q20_04585 [Methanocorpusculum sp.]|nr:hypothetical protein [Methanocorpusculum sp.]